MILTCPQCQTQYNLEPQKLGTGGRTVRCVGCLHTWFQSSSEEQSFVPPPTIEKPAPPPPAEPMPVTTAALPIAEALDTLLTKDEAAFDAILSNAAAGAASKGATEEATRVKVMPPVRSETTPTIITHNPLGVGAAAFGGLTFFLCVFLTLALLFLFQKPIVRHWPQMTLIYKAIGFHLRAPGEGLRIGSVTAEQEEGSKAVKVEGTMTNISEHDIAAPRMYVLLKNEQAKVIKGWNLALDTAKLVSGETVPLMMQIADAPEEGTSIEVRVKEE